jgi:hypothetical protein
MESFRSHGQCRKDCGKKTWFATAVNDYPVTFQLHSPGRKRSLSASQQYLRVYLYRGFRNRLLIPQVFDVSPHPQRQLRSVPSPEGARVSRAKALIAMTGWLRWRQWPGLCRLKRVHFMDFMFNHQQLDQQATEVLLVGLA